MMSDPEKPGTSGEEHPPKAVQVPVYNCPAYIAPPDAEGKIYVRCATLPDVTAFGSNQREALSRLVNLFKQTIAGYRAAEIEIPWQEPPLEAKPGEQSVFIAVHL